MAKTPDARDGADDEACGRRRSRASARRSPTCRRSPTPRKAGSRSRSSRGTTATTPRRCARRSTTSIRTRSSRTSSSTSCATACSGSPASCYGLEFTPVTGVPVYHPDVRVYEVKDQASGKRVGLWYFDPYARTASASGAWMNAYRTPGAVQGRRHADRLEQLELREGRSRASRCSSRGTTRETLFHEFGHALHGLLSKVTYPSLAGTTVARDYVEFPSQLIEHWLDTPEVLNKFALHYQTGEPLPRRSWRRSRRRRPSTRASRRSST